MISNNCVERDDSGTVFEDLGLGSDGDEKSLTGIPYSTMNGFDFRYWNCGWFIGMNCDPDGGGVASKMSSDCVFKYVNIFECVNVFEYVNVLAYTTFTTWSASEYLRM